MKTLTITIALTLSLGAQALANGGIAPQQMQPDQSYKATIGKDGKARVPGAAPEKVQAVIEAGNQIVGKPYRYGGGHSGFRDSGYDCSGSVSYALRGGGLLKRPLASGALMQWGQSGRGQWITVYSNPGHAYLQVAGIRLDTSAAGDPGGGKGPRWRKTLRSHRGFSARHPAGL